MESPGVGLYAAKPLTDGMAAAYEQFLAATPAYAHTRTLDDLRARDYRRLDELGQTYLDYTGGSLYGESQVRSHLELLQRGVFGNPHSSSPASMLSTRLADRARADVLRQFRASPDEYAVIFTQNASMALKLVAESYPFEAGSRLVLLADNHNSVNGLREFASAKGAHVRYVPLTDDLRLDEDILAAELAAGAPAAPSLFAYPAQSNFSGVQHDLGWVARAKAAGFDVLLDAAAFAPTNELRLDLIHPDFVDISFYKLFGYPTGIGCLIARRDALRELRRPWYAGGTVAFASVAAFAGRGSAHRLFDGPFGFEDGTIDYLALPAVSTGLRHLTEAGLDRIHARVMLLTGWLLGALESLRHTGGQPVCEVYGPRDPQGRGAIVLFNILDESGQRLDYTAVQSAADALGISVRSGCHCNPGARETAMHMEPRLLRESFLLPAASSQEFLASVKDRMDGAIRASLGIASNFADVYRLARFVGDLASSRYGAGISQA
jgi:selenocysteine lyase/cysteine desulfurase